MMNVATSRPKHGPFPANVVPVLKSERHHVHELRNIVSIVRLTLIRWQQRFPNATVVLLRTAAAFLIPPNGGGCDNQKVLG
jgi:hypothetical protein